MSQAPKGLLNRIKRKVRRHHFNRPFEDMNGEQPKWMSGFKAPPHVHAHFDLTIDQLPAGTFNLRIAVLADPHVGSHPGDIARLEAAVREINALEPDLIVLPGDFMNMSQFGWGRVPPERIGELLAPLKSRFGCVGVLGNHDRDFGPERVASALERAGIQTLENREIDVNIGNHRIRIVGLEDASTGEPDLERLKLGAGSDLTIVVTHDPALFAYAPPGPLLMICGHTHGGQIVLPVIGPIYNASAAPIRWTYGHIAEGGRHLVVSAGFGTSGIPVRWNRPPELAVITVTGSGPG